MAGYNKGAGAPLDSGVGLCSYKKNPMQAATRTAPECGPGMNPDQKKANKLLQERHKRFESTRGEGV